MKLIVGIDFGTSTTVVRYKVEGTNTVNCVKDANGISDTIPTVIFKCADGTSSMYGNEALSMSRSGVPGELIANFKMGLLDADEQVKRQKEAYIEEFLAFVYKRFAEETVKYAGYDTDIYISFPAKWSDGFVTFMKNAFLKAGFKGNIIGVNEPKAATYNMLFRHLEGLQRTKKLLVPNKPMNIFMLDMGAGTTDIVIFRLNVNSQGMIEIDDMISYPTVDNPYLCGGREIDCLLQKYVLSSIASKNVPFGADGFTIDNAKTWKDQVVSTQLKKGMVLPLPPELLQIMKFLPNGKEAINSFTLSGGQFESATAEHWRNLYSLISSAMTIYKDRFGIGAEDIDMLFLTGGHSQWYTVPNLFNGVGVDGVIGVDHMTPRGEVRALNFKKLKNETWRMFGDSRPHECVATGLCLQDSIPNLQNDPISTCANNVWLQIEINGVKSNPQKVVSVNERLPVFVDDFSIRLGHLKKAIYSDNQKKPFVGTFTVYMGENLRTAQISQYKTEIDFGFWKFVLCNKYLITSKCDILVREDNTIGINGSVTFDPESSIFNAESVTFGNGFDEKHIFDPAFNKTYAGDYCVELLAVDKYNMYVRHALLVSGIITFSLFDDRALHTPCILLSNISAGTAKCLKAKIECHGGKARVLKMK